MTPEIVAAGAVIWRKTPKKDIEIAVVHRPRYDDWTLPKGKVEAGETVIACAYREAQEETGLEFTFGPFIDYIEYLTDEGTKGVSYWAAESKYEEKVFQPNSEVDQLQWWPIAEALEKLTRDSDQEVLAKFLEVPFDASALIMLRHAKALAREEWQGEDEDRPLEVIGQNQARRMLSNLHVFSPKDIYTSDAVRCYDTVIGMARAMGIDPVVSNELSEYTFKQAPQKALDYARDLADLVSKSESTAIVCSHNPVLPRMLAKLLKKSKISDKALPSARLQPGDAWIVFLKKKKVVQIDYLMAP